MTDMTVFYACFYCKKNFYLKKERLKTHWVIGCPKNKLCCTSRCCLSLKTTREETSQPLHTKGRGVECSCLSVEGCPPPVPSVRLLTRHAQNETHATPNHPKPMHAPNSPQIPNTQLPPAQQHHPHRATLLLSHFYFYC